MKTKLNLIQVCLLWAALLPAAVQAQFTYDGFDFSTNNGQITITHYTGTGGTVIIPSNIVVSAISLPVTSIGLYAFSGCSSLTDVTIPNTVTSIGDDAFWACTSLTSVTIPNSVTNLGESAFSECPSLTGVTIPNNVTSLADSLFFDCSSLTSVTIPNRVTSIGNSAFQDCASLTSVTMPNGLTNIGEQAFMDCPRLTSVTIPNTVTGIGEGALSWCISLTAITVAPGNPAYSSVAGVLFNKSQTTLIQCPGAKAGTYLIPNTVTSLGYGAFSDCTNLTSVTIPNSVTNLGIVAFYNCFGLTSVTIPNSVSYIGEEAFAYCYFLTNITIPANVTSIGDYVFYKCSSLTSVTIPNRVTVIGAWAFEYCSSLTNLTIPTRVGTIAYGAFAYCSKLTSVTIPNSVTAIGDDAFWDCSSLASVTILNRIAYMGSSVFAGCTSLTNATIHGNAPGADSTVFSSDPSVTVYYYAGTSGWGSTFGGAPTRMLNPPNQAGSLQVTITPAWAVSAGAQWQVDGGILQPGGATVLGLSGGKHTVSFTAISGCTKPASQTVSIVGGQTNYVVGAYSDTSRPTLSITNVTAGMSVSNQAFTVAGKCGDNTAVASVLVSVNQGAWNSAAWSNQNRNWSESVSLRPGTNTIAAYAVDVFGNVSTTNTVKLIYLLRAALSLQIVGEGVVTPDHNGDLLDIGENYTMQAKGTNGFAFDYWRFEVFSSDGVFRAKVTNGFAFDHIVYWWTSTNPVITFTMTPNFPITAYFVDVTKPVATITSPAANQKWSNSAITVAGKASDNVGVAQVWCQINHGGWTAAQTANGFTNWTAPNLPVTLGTNNIVQAYAVDAAGNFSATNEVKFLGVLAPASLAGYAGTFKPDAGGPEVLVTWGADTWSQTGTGGDTNADDYGAGTHAYCPTGPNTAVLTNLDLGMLSWLGTTNSTTVQLTFTSATTAKCVWTDDQGSATGTVTFSPVDELAPATLAGSTVQIQNGPTLAFHEDGTWCQTEPNGDTRSGVYTDAACSPTVLMLKATDTDSHNPESDQLGRVSYWEMTFTSASGGQFFRSTYDHPAYGSNPDETQWGNFTVTK